MYLNYTLTILSELVGFAVLTRRQVMANASIISYKFRYEGAFPDTGDAHNKYGDTCGEVRDPIKC